MTREGISPLKWGSDFWRVLFWVVIGYPIDNADHETRQAVRQLLQSWTHLLPCGLCRDHLRDCLRGALPLTEHALRNRANLWNYVNQLRLHVHMHHVDDRPFTHIDSFQSMQTYMMTGERYVRWFRLILAVCFLLFFLHG